MYEKFTTDMMVPPVNEREDVDDDVLHCNDYEPYDIYDPAVLSEEESLLLDDDGGSFENEIIESLLTLSINDVCPPPPPPLARQELDRGEAQERSDVTVEEDLYNSRQRMPPVLPSSLDMKQHNKVSVEREKLLSYGNNSQQCVTCEIPPLPSVSDDDRQQFSSDELEELLRLMTADMNSEEYNDFMALLLMNDESTGDGTGHDTVELLPGIDLSLPASLLLPITSSNKYDPLNGIVPVCEPCDDDEIVSLAPTSQASTKDEEQLLLVSDKTNLDVSGANQPAPPKKERPFTVNDANKKTTAGDRYFGLLPATPSCFPCADDDGNPNISKIRESIVSTVTSYDTSKTSSPPPPLSPHFADAEGNVDKHLYWPLPRRRPTRANPNGKMLVRRPVRLEEEKAG